LAVFLGDRRSRLYYAAILFAAYLFWLILSLELRSWAALLPLVTAPLARKNVRLCFAIQDRREFNSLLARSAGLQLAFALVAAVAITVS
jgi:1,4-dihydroxy-2-naphthoate octaprenyltransferase